MLSIRSILVLCFIFCSSWAEGELRSHTLRLERRQNSNATQGHGYDSPLSSKHIGYELTFQAEVTFGNQTLPLLIDTGSSDIWVLGPEWICVNDTSNETLPREACAYGTETYVPSPTFEEIPGMYFGEDLGAGRVSGLFGREDVTIGGATVKGQQIGVVNVSSNFGDGVYTGIVGFGYPSLTSSHHGSIVNADNTSFSVNASTYDPWFNTLVGDGNGKVEPYFSIALDRIPVNETSGPGGYLTLGGLPPVGHSDIFSTAPVRAVPLPAEITGGVPNARSLWAIDLDGITYTAGSNSQNWTTNSTKTLAVVDTGNWFNFLDPQLAYGINDMFDPPGTWDNSTSPMTYSIDCNATPPQLGFTIDGQTLFHNGLDLVYATGNGTCISALVSNERVSLYGITGNIIGDAFLKNVVAVFDFGNHEMKFAARNELGNGTIPGPQPTTPAPQPTIPAGSASTFHVPQYLLLLITIAIIVL